MELTPDLENMGFCLADMNDTDLNDFLRVDKLTFQRYINEFPEFFGDKYNPEIGTDCFHQKRKLKYFKKLLLNDEVVGFMNYDKKDDKIDDISIRIIKKVQNMGIGTLFLSHLIKLSKEFCVPIYIGMRNSLDNFIKCDINIVPIPLFCAFSIIRMDISSILSSFWS